MDLDLTKAVVDKGTGYLYVYSPKHIMANASGKVYVHRWVAQKEFGINLDSTLIVHHIDENKLNNESNNLRIMTQIEHGKLHAVITKCDIICSVCGEIFIAYPKNKYCSVLCSNIIRQRFTITKEELTELIKKYPVIAIAKIYNVSDVSIHKKCKKYNIQKMPKGYFLRK